MIGIYTTEFRQDALTDYVTRNLVALLIKAPAMGYGTNLSNTAVLARRNLTMQQASILELESLGGYTRVLPTLGIITNNEDSLVSTITATCRFTAASNLFPEFTHIVYACGATRTPGDNLGTVVKVVGFDITASITLTNGTSLDHTTSFSFSLGDI